jgi:ATP-dependent DNA ligase
MLTAGPGWLHEIKFDGYRVIAGKDGDRVRVWARTSSDYTAAFTRIRDAVAALSAENVVIDGEAVLPRADGSFDFEGLGLAGDGALIFRHACAMGLEGIVSKRLGSRHVSGRTRAWLKTKNPAFER